jgi:hypothetical protein
MFYCILGKDQQLQSRSLVYLVRLYAAIFKALQARPAEIPLPTLQKKERKTKEKKKRGMREFAIFRTGTKSCLKSLLWPIRKSLSFSARICGQLQKSQSSLLVFATIKTGNVKTVLAKN